ncbi:MAG: alpha-amylase [Bacteroidetes bacterium]|nr:MAG: alpha-amylase [Bacteroidota bacterium]
MKTIILSLLLVFFFTNSSISQIVTTNPSLPTANAAVTITFDATQGNAGLAGYTDDIYAHTGVITDKSTDGGDWMYVIAGWSENTEKAKMTPLGNDKYELVIDPSITEFYAVNATDTIKQMAFVFRNADGSKVGKTAAGGDIFVDVYEPGLAISITNPDIQPYFVDAASNFDIHVEGTEATEAVIKSDGSTIHTETVSPNSFDYTVTAEASGTHEITVEATDGSETATDNFFYVVRSTPVVEALPAGVHDGINYIDDNTVTLVLHAPFKNSIYAFGSFNDWQPLVMKKNVSDVNDPELRYWISLTSLTAGKEYFFQYLVDEELKIAEPYSDKISDPWNDKYIPDATYPNLIAFPEGKTEGIASIFQTAQTTYSWNVTNFTPPAVEDLVIYETLIRDFTANANYQTMIDTIGYLKRLGINAIELMPINEFDGNDSWGYNPAFYFAVDKAYGTKDKFKEFVDVCHANGIAVIIDMVLNHSYGQSPLVQLYYDAAAGDWGQPTEQNPWYNEVSPNQSYSWGYDFDHESVYTKAFVDSVNSYWLTEYKVDGFRFDFTKGFTNTPGDGWAYDGARIAILKRMYDEIKLVNPNTYVIFEHLADNTEEKELSTHGILLWGNMSGKYTNAAIGNIDSDYSDLSWGSYLNRGWTDPNLVTYMESHDEQRLMYSAKVAGKSNGDYNIKEVNTALKRMEMDACFFFPIPGPKMIWQFGELGYDISIDENGRTGKKPVLWNYYDVNDRYRLYQVYQALIALKIEHNVFRTTDYSMDVAGVMKSIHLNDADMNVTIIGNFDVLDRRIDPNFQSIGTWYDYFSGEEITVANVNSEIILKAGEYRLYTDVKLDTPDIVADVEKIDLGMNNLVKLNIFPNPAKNNTTISVVSDEYFEQVSLNIYNIHGTLVRNLYSGKLLKGQNEFNWDLKNINGQRVPSGIYFSTIQAKNFLENRLMIVD